MPHTQNAFGPPHILEETSSQRDFRERACTIKSRIASSNPLVGMPFLEETLVGSRFIETLVGRLNTDATASTKFTAGIPFLKSDVSKISLCEDLLVNIHVL